LTPEQESIKQKAMEHASLAPREDRQDGEQAEKNTEDSLKKSVQGDFAAKLFDMQINFELVNSDDEYVVCVMAKLDQAAQAHEDQDALLADGKASLKSRLAALLATDSTWGASASEEAKANPYGAEVAELAEGDPELYEAWVAVRKDLAGGGYWEEKVREENTRDLANCFTGDQRMNISGNADSLEHPLDPEKSDHDRFVDRSDDQCEADLAETQAYNHAIGIEVVYVERPKQVQPSGVESLNARAKAQAAQSK